MTELRQSYQETQRQEYVRNLKNLHEVLTTQLQDSITFGPTYKVATTDGAEVVVTTMNSRKPITNTSFSEPVDETFIMIAQDPEGSIVGHRVTGMRKEFGHWEARGDISVGERGKGYATALELVHADILQQKAYGLYDDVYYTIDDGNKRKLVELRESAKVSEDPELVAHLSQKERERERWLALYGPSGKLGFGKYGSKKFETELSGIFDGDLSHIDEFVLERYEYEEEGRTFVAGGIVDHKEFPPGTSRQEVKGRFYRDTLLPKIEAALLS